MGIWDKFKKAFGGGKGTPPTDGDPSEMPDPPPGHTATPAITVRKRRPSGRTWRLTKRGSTLALEAPHGTFVVKGIADEARATFAALAEGAEVVCDGEYDGGSTITDLVITHMVVFSPPVAAPLPPRRVQPPARSTAANNADDDDDDGDDGDGVAPPSQVGTDEQRWMAAEILGLSQDELRKRALKINPYRTPWIGRVDTIPPQTDERTAIIDRGLILRGLLTPTQIDQIHAVGDQWILHHDAMKLAEAAAAKTADDAIAAARAEKAKAKAERQAAATAREAARVAAVAHRKQTDIIFAGRGVSGRLHDRRANPELLAANGLDVLATPMDLATALGLSIRELRWLCFHNEAAAKTHYVYFEIPKRSGGTRLLAAPHEKLAAAQRWVFEHVLGKLEVTRHAHGFVPARSTVTNARLHVGKAIVINLDLQNFFPTITFPRVRGLFESLGYSPAVATLLALLCTESPRVKVLHDGAPFWVAAGDRALPQGACTSPVISNLVSRKLDRRLAGATAKLGWTFSRYADDLTFSTDTAGKPKMSLVMSRVRAIVRDEGFAINEAKGRVQRAARRQQVTGIVVNDKVAVPREDLRRIRAILHRAKSGGLAAQNRDGHQDFKAFLRGTLAYYHMIDPAKAAPLIAALDALS